MPGWIYYFLLTMIPVAFLNDIGKGQDWNVKKQKDDVTIWVRPREDNGIKEYRAVTHILAPVEVIYNEIIQFEDYTEWMEDLKSIEVLDKKAGEYYVYALTYDVPWPFSDRDMVARATVSEDTSSETVFIESLPANGLTAKQDNVIRIEDFWQNWTLQPLSGGSVKVVLEGYNDPGGSIPDWLVNWGLVDTPFSILKNLKERCEDQEHN